MPPKRRSTGPAAATRNSQPRLSFAKGQSTKVTKPSIATADVKKSLAAKKAHEIEAAVEITTPTTAEVSVEEQIKSELKDPVTQSHTTEDVVGGRAKSDTTGAVGGPTNTGWVSDEETRARKTPQKRINEYWAAKEAARKAPRVHQQDLSLGEKILREWDMSNEYGPCIGMAGNLIRVLQGLLTLYRHCTNEALEAGKRTWVESSDRSPCCSAPEYGR